MARGRPAVSEMTEREARSLATAVAAKRGPLPGLEARGVLQAVLLRLAAGGELPSQEAFAWQLGIGEERLRARLYELERCGFVLLSRRGSRPASYEVVRERVRAWVRGDLEPLLSPDFAATNGGLSPETAATNGELYPENPGTTSRARVNASSSSSSSSSAVSAVVAADATAAAAFEAKVLTARGYLKTAGVKMVYRNLLDLRRWLSRDTVQLEDVDFACEQAARHAPATWAYVVAIFEDIEAKAEAEAAVIRGPWGREGTL